MLLSHLHPPHQTYSYSSARVTLKGTFPIYTRACVHTPLMLQVGTISW